MLYRLGHLVDDVWRMYSHPPLFEAQKERIVSAAPASDPLVFKHLLACLNPPFHLLYVLHTPRGEGDAGRYQSPAISSSQVAAFLERFDDLFRGDGRFDLWLHSPGDHATIVWDRHDLIFAYGPTDAYEGALRRLGFTLGEPIIPFPHEHHYRAELDEQARGVLQAFDWRFNPLEEEDEQ